MDFVERRSRRFCRIVAWLDRLVTPFRSHRRVFDPRPFGYWRRGCCVESAFYRHNRSGPVEEVVKPVQHERERVCSFVREQALHRSGRKLHSCHEGESFQSRGLQPQLLHGFIQTPSSKMVGGVGGGDHSWRRFKRG